MKNIITAAIAITINAANSQHVTAAQDISGLLIEAAKGSTEISESITEIADIQEDHSIALNN